MGNLNFGEFVIYLLTLTIIVIGVYYSICTLVRDYKDNKQYSKDKRHEKEDEDD